MWAKGQAYESWEDSHSVGDREEQSPMKPKDQMLAEGGIANWSTAKKEMIAVVWSCKYAKYMPPETNF